MNMRRSCRACFRWRGWTGKSWSDVIVSSVVPEADFHIKKFCKKYLRKKPLIGRATRRFRLKVDLDRPEEVGADRLVNALSDQGVL
jgi:type III pantothenate kinase